MKLKITFMFCSFLASAICLLAVAQSDQSKAPASKQWPKNGQSESDHRTAVTNAVKSFTAVLTRAGYDRQLRNRLTASCDSAKQAVSKEGNIDIPDDVIIMFYEPDTRGDHFGFSLPPFNEQARAPYKYTDDDYYQCCFPGFRKFLMTTAEPSLEAALNAAMTRAGYDSTFRKQLTVSCDSAKKAVSDEGHIQIGNEVQMIFHEGEWDERYHIFELPPYDPNSKKQHEYRKYFRGLYPVWHQ